MSDMIYERLQKVFRDIFEDEKLILTEQTTSADIEDWDSFAQIGLVMEIEREFEIKFKLNEVSKLNNVGEMVALIGQKLGR